MGGDQLTKAAQETAVGEGLAVGCLALGVVAVTAEKMAVEFAFRRAWSGWGWSPGFRAVNVSHERNDLLRILHASPRRRGSFIAEWSSGREHEPRLRGDWDLEASGAALEDTTGVPLDGWIELARYFVDDLGENKIRRTG